MMSVELKRVRTVAKSRFTRMRKSAEDAVAKGVLRKTAESRFQQFKASWEEVQSCHENYIASLSGDELEEEWIEELCTLFDATEISVDNYLDKIGVQEKKEELMKLDDEVSKKEEERERLLFERETLALLVARDQESLKFQKIIENIEKISKIVSDKNEQFHIAETIDDLLRKLEKCLDECGSIHQKYVARISEREERERESEWWNSMLDSFHNIHGKAKLYVSKLMRPPEKTSDKIEKSNLQVSKMNFEAFDGSIRKYPRFKEQFKRHIKPQYKGDEEAFVLRSYLTESIREEVDNLGEEAGAIWDRLDRKYGDAGKLVESIMSDVKFMKRCDGNPKQTLKMINTIEKAHRDLVYLKREEEINNATIISMIEEKLPEDIETEWIKMVTGERRAEMEKKKFSNLLELLLQFRERIEYKHADLRGGVAFHTKDERVNNVRGKYERGFEDPVNNKSLCWLHPNQSDHPIWKCKDFCDKPVAERLSLVKENRACYTCLSQWHISKNCRRNFVCREGGCNLKHHRLLHEAHTLGLAFHGTTEKTCNQNTLLQLQRVKATNINGKAGEINVLWDAGSTLSFITFEKAAMLNLQGKRERLQIVKVGGEVEELDSCRYKFHLIDTSGQRVEIVALGLERISTEIDAVKSSDVTKIFQSANFSNFSRPESGYIDCLIGLNYAAYHPVKEQAVGHLIFLKNRFGSTIAGKHPEILEKTQRLVSYATVYHIKTELTEFQKLEQLGIECQPRCGGCKCGKCQPGGKGMTLKEEREFQLIQDGLTYDPQEKKWTAKYPFIKDARLLPNNRRMALKYLHSTESRLKRNPAHASIYKEQMSDMIDRKVCRKLTPDEIKNYNGPVFYISHHEILKPDSKSTPCRIVFNSSANYQGHILNDYYAKGPQMLNNLLGILLRFREEQFGIAGDIKKMYHSIKTAIVDQMTHRFLWRDLDERKEPEEYVITAVNFGDRPSGAIAIAALRLTADMGKERSEKASSIIKHNSYMDDILESCKSPEDGKRMMKLIEEILMDGGFQMKEWVTSNDASKGEQGNDSDEKSIINEKVLGLEWNHHRDELHFKAKLNFSEKKRKLFLEPNLRKEEVPRMLPTILTKRQILGQVNGIFDPLGLLSPFTVKAKIFLRKLWGQEEKLGWDDPIPYYHLNDWIRFFTELWEVEDISFKRCVKPKNAIGKPTLIVFSDGSGDVYGAVAYVRWKLDDDTFKVNLLAAKNRIAPLKVINIVRLELCGAVVSKRLRTFIVEEMRYEFERVYHIVDSEIVKGMISKQSYGFNTFAANRIGEIQQGTDPSEWYWLSGKLNIADCVTRGKSPKELGEGSLWQCGPDFLYVDERDWLLSNETNVVELPERPKSVFFAANVKVETLTDRIDINRFGKLQFLMNTTARIVGLFRRFERNAENSSSFIQVSDLEKAERMWILDAQREIKQGVKEGKMKKLCPKIQNEVIVVGGRAERWMSETWNRQAFILLPHKHRFSWLVAEHKHRELGHLGVSATVAGIRSKFWIVKLWKMVTYISSRCILCKIKYKRMCGQIMADLPLQRLKPVPPFSATGCDYFGPFMIKGEVQKRVRGKCFGVLFTCLVTRAVYVDISQNYSTDGFLQVLRRFASLRGWPKDIYSDRGSQLVSASKELKVAVSGMEERQLRRLSVKHGTEWNFCPPDAPWMNGATEALIKSVKRALNTAIGSQILSFVELQTVMFECAQLVNQRPIGHNPVNPEDGSYICPNDMLLGRCSPEIPQGPFQNRCSSKHRIDLVQQYASAFWQKWMRDCFPNMILQPKWHTERRDVMEKDVVLIQDSNVVRGEWRMGIVRKPIPSSDGKVRKAIVAYKNFPPAEKSDTYRGAPYTEVERAVHRLIVLVAVDDPEEK